MKQDRIKEGFYRVKIGTVTGDMGVDSGMSIDTWLRRGEIYYITGERRPEDGLLILIPILEGESTRYSPGRLFDKMFERLSKREVLELAKENQMDLVDGIDS